MPDFRCTYRLQLSDRFGFREARELAVPYVAGLGASHLYLSPSLQARHGSTHGYDVVDPTRISSDLGGEAEFRSLCAAARDAGLGVILDIVPNHMATSEEENPFWRDRELRAKFFDWDPATGWYRRFFDIGELAGVRVEDPEVFAATHAKVLELVARGPGRRLAHRPPRRARRTRASTSSGCATRGAEHVWVEKILEPGERLRDWPVEGTTGYEFANDVTALFVDPAGEGPLTDALRGADRRAAHVRRSRRRGEARGCAHDVLAGVRAAPRALSARRPRGVGGARCMSTERTSSPRRAASTTTTVVPTASLPDDLQRVLLLEERSPALDEFVVRWQQTTGPVMAKGIEDTAFYRYFRLTALNEVGGDPGRFTLAPDAFHEATRERADRHPRWLLASQTHDTKRAGDVRARIGALAGMHERWAERVRIWRDLTGGMDDPNEEYLVWQTLVGAWPIVPIGSSGTSRRRCARRSGTRAGSSRTRA